MEGHVMFESLRKLFDLQIERSETNIKEVQDSLNGSLVVAPGRITTKSM